MSRILNQYEITFNNSVFEGYNRKFAYTTHLSSGAICSMLNVMYHLIDCDDIIYMIEYAQSHTGYSEFHSLDGVIGETLEINSTNVVINDFDNFPLSDFKEIVEEWRYFLETPPLHMQIINENKV